MVRPSSYYEPHIILLVVNEHTNLSLRLKSIVENMFVSLELVPNTFSEVGQENNVTVCGQESFKFFQFFSMLLVAGMHTLNFFFFEVGAPETF